MAPDTGEWFRKISILKKYLEFALSLKVTNFKNKQLVSRILKALKTAKFQHKKYYRRDKRILLMNMFEDKFIDMNSIWKAVNKFTDNQLSFFNAST